MPSPTPALPRSSFASGALLSGVGWGMVQIAIMPFVAIAAGAVLWSRQRASASEPRYARP